MEKGIVTSSGAIVLREVDGELKMALTRTPGKHGLDTWFLPKGHVELGETLEQTALREVHEEVGLSKVQLITYLGCFDRTSVKSSGEVVQKRVHLYLAYALDTEQFEFPPGQHPTEAGWFSFPQAMQYIPYEKDRDFLTEHVAQLSFK